MRILALCETNAALSQMAEGWLRALSTPDVEVWSAGTSPTHPRLEAVAVMREVGIDLSHHRATAVQDVPEPDVVAGFGDLRPTLRSAPPAPVWPNHPERLTWDVPDPADQAGGTWAERLAVFRVARDRIFDHCDAFLRARDRRIAFGAPVRPQFALRTDMTFLNHGSFGAAPRVVLEAQRRFQDELEAQPLAFMRALPVRVRRVAALVASFLSADPQDLVFVDNATSGVTAVLRSHRFQPGDVIYTTSHAYLAVRAGLEHVCLRTGARLVVGDVPFPLASSEEVLDVVDRTMPDETRLAVFDEITSITGLVFPVRELVERCRARRIPVLIDGAHVPGHLPTDLEALDADYWVGNCHKWLFAPKGCAVLHVRRDHHEGIDPLVFSHGIGTSLSGAFDFQGTRDPSPWLAMEAALQFVNTIGADRIRAHNCLLRAEAAAMLCQRLNVQAPGPTSMLGALATLPLPFTTEPTRAAADALNARLWDQHRIEAMFMPFGDRVWLRIACQIYNELADYERLAEVLAG